MSTSSPDWIISGTHCHPCNHDKVTYPSDFFIYQLGKNNPQDSLARLLSRWRLLLHLKAQHKVRGVFVCSVLWDAELSHSLAKTMCQWQEQIKLWVTSSAGRSLSALTIEQSMTLPPEAALFFQGDYPLTDFTVGPWYVIPVAMTACRLL